MPPTSFVCGWFSIALTRSILLTAFSSLSSLAILSLSLRSSSSILSSSLARALRSVATISFACEKSWTLSSSISESTFSARSSALARRVRSRSNSLRSWTSGVGGIDGGRWGLALLGEERRPVRNEKREVLAAVPPAVDGRVSSVEGRDASMTSDVWDRVGRPRSCASLRARIWSS
jgi:hypothetical protein